MSDKTNLYLPSLTPLFLSSDIIPNIFGIYDKCTTGKLLCVEERCKILKKGEILATERLLSSYLLWYKKSVIPAEALKIYHLKTYLERSQL